MSPTQIYQRRCAFLTLFVLSACCHTVPQPSVFGIPPALVSAEKARIEIDLPVKDPDQIERFIQGCVDDGSVLCDYELPDGVDCVISKLVEGGGGFDEIAGCESARPVEIYDARAQAPFHGYEVSRWIFAAPRKRKVIVFMGYFPQPVK